jgi:hypothetical protein
MKDIDEDTLKVAGTFDSSKKFLAISGYAPIFGASVARDGQSQLTGCAA